MLILYQIVWMSYFSNLARSNVEWSIEQSEFQINAEYVDSLLIDDKLFNDYRNITVST